VFEVSLLPAREGDCIWIRYGTEAAPRQILIDGGRSATAKSLADRLGGMSAGQREFELWIVSHVDRDHIEGVYKLLSGRTLKARFKDIWFNGYGHLQRTGLESFGAVQGERLSALLLDGRHSWNGAWKKRAVCVGKGALPRRKLAGGLQLTLLSPDAAKLSALVPDWERECKRAGLYAGIGSRPAEARGLESFGALDIDSLAELKFDPDPATANGSSIAVLAEFGGKRLLLAADAHADRLVESLKKLKGSAKRVAIDAFKISHHGSEHNLSKEVLSLVDCRRYLISTNGAYFKHPSPIAVARIVKYGGKGATIYFNYRSRYTEIWDNPAWQARYGYRTQYPARRDPGVLRLTL